MPLHLQEYFEYLRYQIGDFPISELVSKEMMSFPMNPYLTKKEIFYSPVKELFKEKRKSLCLGYIVTLQI